jgi:hypothetical protein
LTERLDRAPTPTRTRHPRRDTSTASRFVRGPLGKSISTTGKTPTRATPGIARPILPPPPTLRQKSEHLIRLPTTSYRHGYSCDRRGNNTYVSPHFFTVHPGMGGESLSLYTPYCTLFYHRPPSKTDTTRTVSPDLRDSALSTSLDPTLTRPRRPPPVSKRERPTWHRTQGHFTASSPTSSRCPGMASHS